MSSYDGLVAEAFPYFAPPGLVLDDERAHLKAATRSGARSALELGCGYGRVVSWFRANGVHCEGVDTSADLIARARSFDPDVAIHLGDISTFRSEAAYDYVFATDATISLVGSREGLLATACASYSNLRQGGRFAFTMSESVNDADGVFRVRGVASSDDFTYVSEDAGVLGENGVQLVVKRMSKFQADGSLAETVTHLHRNVVLRQDEAEEILTAAEYEAVAISEVGDRTWIASGVRN